MKNFITGQEFKKLKNPVIIDVRVSMQDKDYGYDAYETYHIKDAYYLNLEDDLAGIPGEVGGHHPFPNKEEFQSKLRKMGITKDSDIIIYDDGDNAASGRLWFLLKYFGLKNVKIVNGGIKELINNGIEINNIKTLEKDSDLVLEENNDLIASYEEIKEYANEPKDGQVLIDSRSHERYLGNIEPKYKVAGHIPHAINYDFTENFNNKKIKSTKELEERFEKLKDKKDIIVSCGSGVTACSNIVALDEIDIPTRLYIGSYSEWIDRNNKVNKGEE